MEDKEKQIEEMASDLRGDDYAVVIVQGKSTKLSNQTKNYLKRLIDKGYRKITEDSILLSKTDFDLILPPDSVVLSREELNTIQANFFDSGIKHGSKETAEKILKWLTSKRHLFNRTHEVGFEKPRTSYLVLNDEIEEIAKQFGVEIKE